MADPQPPNLSSPHKFSALAGATIDSVANDPGFDFTLVLSDGSRVRAHQLFDSNGLVYENDTLEAANIANASDDPFTHVDDEIT